MPVKFFRLGLTISLAICLLLGCPLTGAAQKQLQKTKEKTVTANLPEDLPRILGEGAAVLDKEAGHLKSRAAALQKGLAHQREQFQKQKAVISALKASLAVAKLAPGEAEGALKKYSQRQEHVKKRLKELVKEMGDLKKGETAREESQKTLQAEVAQLRSTRHPVGRSQKMGLAWQRYQRAAGLARQAARQVLASLKKESQLLVKENALLTEVRADLQNYDETTWKKGLLKRQKSVSLTEQAAQMFQTFLKLPGRVATRLTEMASSGALLALLQKNLAILIGLLALVVLLVWGTRRLTAMITPPLAAWETQAQTLGLRTLASLGRVVGAHLLLLAALLLVGMALWSLSLWQVTAWRMFFYLLLSLAGLRLGRHWLKAAFAGEGAGGLLPVDDDTAGFYRKNLQLLLLYLLAGAWVLAYAEPLGFVPTSSFFLAHFYRVGLLAWAIWLLRERYLTKLLPELPGPAWFKHLGVIRTLKVLVLLLLTSIIIANLLGFQNLADYLAEAGAFTGLALLFLALMWLGVDAVLHYLLHPEKGWARRRYPQREEMLQRIHALTRRGFTALLAAVAILLAMKAWGLEADKLSWAFRWVNWGPALGSVKLTPLTIGATILTIYLAVWLSRLLRSLLDIRVFPRTDWDTGVQYTIATSVHYVVLVLGILVALNVLGFPLTNIALIFGALGVGIGFGLQNIVNNFLSGLILLFERPIKVGDMLVIDGQWGMVKEIRVRSTVFQTFDRYVLIIPNSELLSGKILNWTHYGWGLNRMELKVGVGYGSDVRQVTRIITELCQANPRVLDDPPPQVFFKAYGDSSLDFTIWIFLHHPSDRIPATHEINTAMFEAFQQEGIEIPFPQRDLHIKNWPARWGKEKEQS